MSYAEFPHYLRPLVNAPELADAIRRGGKSILRIASRMLGSTPQSASSARPHFPAAVDVLPCAYRQRRSRLIEPRREPYDFVAILIDNDNSTVFFDVLLGLFYGRKDSHGLSIVKQSKRASFSFSLVIRTSASQAG
jgi:hypothetical protein